jgi:hypothetical protein
MNGKQASKQAPYDDEDDDDEMIARRICVVIYW